VGEAEEIERRGPLEGCPPREEHLKQTHLVGRQRAVDDVIPDDDPHADPDVGDLGRTVTPENRRLRGFVPQIQAVRIDGLHDAGDRERRMGRRNETVTGGHADPHEQNREQA
jgi:hypothetical protein